MKSLFDLKRELANLALAGIGKTPIKDEKPFRLLPAPTRVDAVVFYVEHGGKRFSVSVDEAPDFPHAT